MKILIACFPKSGSTYLSSLIGNLPGYSIQSYVPAHGRREQELSEYELASRSKYERQVAQHHVRASEYTLDLIQKFNLTPIVLVRNLYDAVVSMADHIVTASPSNSLAYFDNHIAQLPTVDRANAVLDLAAPWYFNFYVSWWRAQPKAMVRYEDLILGGPERQTEYFNSIGLDTSIGEVLSSHALLNVRNTRFNIGIAGRGKGFDANRREHIEKLASYYPDVDFSSIGIDKKSSG